MFQIYDARYDNIATHLCNLQYGLRCPNRVGSHNYTRSVARRARANFRSSSGPLRISYSYHTLRTGNCTSTFFYFPYRSSAIPPRGTRCIISFRIFIRLKAFFLCLYCAPQGRRIASEFLILWKEPLSHDCSLAQRHFKTKQLAAVGGCNSWAVTSAEIRCWNDCMMERRWPDFEILLRAEVPIYCGTYITGYVF